MNGEFGNLWKGLWLFLGTPLQFSGRTVETCICMIAVIPIEIQSQTRLTTLIEWRARAYGHRAANEEFGLLKIW